jgi:NADH-quinone oxidoreductase subunit L
MPVTFFTYAIGMMALSGVPLLFSGAWTKEEILHATSHWPVSHAPHYLVMLGVVLTALYMTRQMIYIFFGNRRRNTDLQSVRAAELNSAEPVSAGKMPAGRTGKIPVFQHPHESPAVMTGPLVALAFGTISLSVVLTPAWPWLENFLSGEHAHAGAAGLVQPALFVSLVLVAIGIGLAFLFYRRIASQSAIEADPLETAQPALFRFLERKMWIDEIYRGSVILLSKTIARLSDWLDRYFWDGLVRAFGSLGQLFGIFTSNLDERAINAGIDETTVGARRMGRLAALAHSGQVQLYLGVIAIGTLALLLIYAWLA